jgi:hypothetical protein
MLVCYMQFSSISMPIHHIKFHVCFVYLRFSALKGFGEHIQGACYTFFNAT